MRHLEEPTMETAFEKQVLESLSVLRQGMNTMKEELNLIKEIVVDDSILSDDDKEALKETLEEEKEGKLLAKQQVFG